MNVTKPNLVNNLDGKTTRNIDGRVYTITCEGDVVTVKDKFGAAYPAAVDASGIITADLASPESTGELAFDLTPEQVSALTGFKPAVETINGRAAMLGFLLVALSELASGKTFWQQLFSVGGFLGVPLVIALAAGGSVAPLATGKVKKVEDGLFPSESDTYPDELLPTFWTATAESVNAKAAMVGLAALMAQELVSGSPTF